MAFGRATGARSSDWDRYITIQPPYTYYFKSSRWFPFKGISYGRYYYYYAVVFVKMEG